ncbi:MAG: 4-methyl-5(b-hydroxyethyl)-thiazole monophosphate biosynthesis [Pseudohongiellaceae bacterium]|jgi:4-methyl-5(b-hydroxyethyl)-thiazole monophosphate biosynthesis
MKKVMMLLANGVEPLEMAAFSDVLGWATLVGDEAIELIDVGMQSQIKTTFGLQLQPNYLLKDINLDDFDALAIPGGFEPSGFYDDALSEPFLEVIRHFATEGKVIASVCVAAIALGESGVLKGKKATTYHQAGGKRKNQLIESGALFIDEAVVIDENVITSTGPGTAIEVALTLLEKLSSKNNADDLRTVMRIPTPNKKWLQAPQV